MNILFIGAFAPQKLIEQYPQYCLDKYKVSNFMIDGLRRKKDVNMNVITSPDLPSYPKYPKVFVKKVFSHTEYQVSSFNLPIIKQLWTILSMYFAAVRIIKKNDGVTNVMIPYMVFRHVCVVRLLKFVLGRRIRICIVIPDVFFPSKKNIVLYYVNRWTEKEARKSDEFVLYTDSMADYLNIRDKRYIVTEGFLDDNLFSDQNKISISNKKSIIYSGTLAKKYGILRLLSAMSLIEDENVELLLYGNGDAVDDIEKISQKDRRVKFMGWLPKVDMLKVLRSATVLVNPRSITDGEFTQYSCPSKILEYLMSEVPSVICKLPGIPKEYYGYFICADDSSIMSLAYAIKKGLMMTDSERQKWGSRGKLFVLERVGISHQCERIYNLLNY